MKKILDPQRTTDFTKLTIWKEEGKYYIRKMSNFLGVIELKDYQLNSLLKKIVKILIRKQKKDIERYCPCCSATLPPNHRLLK